MFLPLELLLFPLLFLQLVQLQPTTTTNEQGQLLRDNADALNISDSSSLRKGRPPLSMNMRSNGSAFLALATPSYYNCSAEPPPRPLTVSGVDYSVQHYIFPFLFILGFLGNSINLLVLLSSGMRNQFKANTLLSAMAFSDLGFLLSMLPHSLGSFSVCYNNVHFRYIYFLAKPHLVGLANCFSTATTFFVLAVSMERFRGVRRPMHTRFQLHDAKMMGLIGGIFSFAVALTFFHHLQYTVKQIVIGCRNVWARIGHIVNEGNSPEWLLIYVRYANYAEAIVGVALPVIAVAILNVSLIYFLRRREILVERSRVVTNGSGNSFDQHVDRHSELSTFQRQERKVTAAVIAIVTCFSITHLPSLLPILLLYYEDKISVLAMNNINTVLNTLVVSGKVLNFVLFCFSSANFRRRALIILTSYVCRNRYRKKYSSMGSTLPAAANHANQLGIGAVPSQMSLALLGSGCNSPNPGIQATGNDQRGGVAAESALLHQHPAGTAPRISYRRRLSDRNRRSTEDSSEGGDGRRGSRRGVHALWRGMLRQFPSRPPPPPASTITQQISIDS